MSAALTSPTNLIELRPADEKRARPRRRSETGTEPRNSGPHMFPLATAVPNLPPMIPDEILDFYGFVFCQGGFRQSGMTFEQFLTVVAVVKPSDLLPPYAGRSEWEPSSLLGTRYELCG
jgi:hypothetical protein